nr:unnamed protein product [Callosobruchus analis]
MEEHLIVVRCFKCAKYGHISKYCRSENAVCHKCSENHETKNCVSNNKCCPNCKFPNLRYKTNWPLDHSANSQFHRHESPETTATTAILDYRTRYSTDAGLPRYRRVMDEDPEKTEKLKCKICFEFADRRSIKCSVCGIYIHKKCFDLVAKVFAVEIKNRKCRSCLEEEPKAKKDYDTSGTDVGPDSEIRVLKKEIDCLLREKELISKLANEREYTTDIQKKRMAELEATTAADLGSDKYTVSTTAKKVTPYSYSQAVKTVNSPCLLIKSADGTVPGDLIEREFKSKYTPGSLNADINSCGSAGDLDNLKRTLQSDIGSKYNICDSTKFRHRVVIEDIPKGYTKDRGDKNKIELKNNSLGTMISDNKLSVDENELKIIRVVLECPPSQFKFLLCRGFVYIGWVKCRLEEHLNVVRCFKCAKYGHISKDCRSENAVCHKCSENHETKNCVSNNKCCPNCKLPNLRYKTNWPLDHSASSTTCNFYLKKVHTIRLKTSYE